MTTIELISISAADITDDDRDAILSGIAKCSDDLEVYNLEIISITDSSLQRRRSLLEDITPGARIDYTTTLILEHTTYSDASTLVCVHFGGLLFFTHQVHAPTHAHTLATPTHTFAYSLASLHNSLLTPTAVLLSNIRCD